MTDPNTEDVLAEALLAWEEGFEQGLDPTAAELCPDRPDLVDELAARIALLRQTAWMNQPITPVLDAPGDTLAGRYRLDTLLGEGGFGRVWRAFDQQDQRWVAVKLPRPDRNSFVVSQSLRTEAQKVNDLNCPGIVPVNEVGVDGGRPFIVSELIEGTDLARRLRAGPFPVREAVEVVAQAARILDHAHRHWMVHRDVKPANLLLDNAGRVWVTDFGIAISLNEAVVRAADRAGTLAYMSPERVAGDPAQVDAQSDVFSLGVVLFELLTQRRPFASDTPEGVRRNITSWVVPALDESVPEEVRRIYLRCVVPRCSLRYKRAGELAAELDRWLGGGEYRPDSLSDQARDFLSTVKGERFRATRAAQKDEPARPAGTDSFGPRAPAPAQPAAPPATPRARVRWWRRRGAEMQFGLLTLKSPDGVLHGDRGRRRATTRVSELTLAAAGLASFAFGSVVIVGTIWNFVYPVFLSVQPLLNRAGRVPVSVYDLELRGRIARRAADVGVVGNPNGRVLKLTPVDRDSSGRLT